MLFCWAARRVGIHQDLEQADHLLVHHERGDDQREFGRVERLRHPLDDRAGRNDLRLRRLEHAAQQGVVRGRLDAAVHQAGRAELDLVLQPQPAPAVHHPERAAGRGDRRHRSVQELDVKLVGLNVRFRQIGDLGHQLANLVFRLLEQTGINVSSGMVGTSG